MTSDEPPPPAGLPGDRKPQRKAPTIDLKATEIEPPSAGAAETAATAEDAESSTGTSAGAPPHPPPAADDSGPQAGGRAWYNNTSIWFAAAAGAVAGACSFLLLQAAISLGPVRDGDVSSLHARLGQVEAKLREGSPPATREDQKRLDEFASRIGKLEAAGTAPRPASDTAAANRLSTIEGELRALSESVGILGRRSDEGAVAARDARQRGDATAVELTELRQKLAPTGTDALRKLDGDLQSALSRLAAVERAQKTVESELAKQESGENRDRSGRLAIAATALADTVHRGQPFASELAAVKSLARDRISVSPLEPFAAAGLPSAAALARELTTLMPQLYTAAGGPPREGGFLERLQANAEKLVRIRPLDAAQGSDPTAIVARIEAKAAKGDVTGALVELESLPPAVRAPAEPWMKKAQDRSAAIEASRRLAADALAGLTK